MKSGLPLLIIKNIVHIIDAGCTAAKERSGGQCAFGNTVLDHCVAVAVVRDSAGTGGEPAAEDFAITCISFAGALWPGQAS